MLFCPVGRLDVLKNALEAAPFCVIPLDCSTALPIWVVPEKKSIVPLGDCPNPFDETTAVNETFPPVTLLLGAADNVVAVDAWLIVKLTTDEELGLKLLSPR